MNPVINWYHLGFVVWCWLVLIAAMWAMSNQYRIVYAATLYRGVPGMTMREAWFYPTPDAAAQRDPAADAHSEMFEMRE